VPQVALSKNNVMPQTDRRRDRFQRMPRILNFYMDDSGTRTPDRKPLPFRPNVRELFALGGVLINEEDEAPARKLYADFCDRWSIGYPLHSVEIRH
jgi:hypothetical protein